jgi:hypothetical protein
MNTRCDENKFIDCNAHINRRKVVAASNNIVSVVLLLRRLEAAYLFHVVDLKSDKITHT